MTALRSPALFAPGEAAEKFEAFFVTLPYGGVNGGPCDAMPNAFWFC
jgi:hypothetical protein